MRHFILLSLFLICASHVVAQEHLVAEEEDSDLLSEVVIEPIFSTPPSIELLVSTTVRFDNTASAYLKWKAIDGVSNYRVSYRLKNQGGRWQSEASATNEVILSNLLLDEEYEWNISEEEGNSGYGSIEGSFETVPQSEPIALSAFFYKAFTDWTNTDGKGVLFCDFLDQLDIHPLEKLAFLQVYSFENEPLVFGGNSQNLSDWYPEAYRGFNCLGYDTTKDLKAYCGCKVITQAANNFSPGSASNGFVNPREEIYVAYSGNVKTWVDVVEAGAAKFISLRQDRRGGSMNYQRSNILEDGASESTSAVSEIKFFLSCTRGDEVGTELPERCSCTRELHAKYRYVTSLHVKAEKKNSIWDKGAAADAQDVAFVVSYDERTERTNALAAGQAALARRCSSSWNVGWWRNFLDLAMNALAFLQGNGNSGSGNIDIQEATNLGNSLINLVETPFFDRQGYCETLTRNIVLVDGASFLTLRPNRPIRVSLFSSYYVMSRGYGAWESRSSVASDYYLSGVVVSPYTRDSECCAGKVATYIVGSQSNIPGGGVPNYAVNTVDGNLRNVSFHLAEYGSWYNFPTDPFSGNIRLLTEYNILFGSSCGRNIDDGPEPPRGGISVSRSRPNPRETLVESHTISSIYPSIVQDILNVQLGSGTGQYVQLVLMDSQGRQVQQLDISNHFGNDVVSLNTSSLPSGIYFVHITNGQDSESHKIVKQ